MVDTFKPLDIFGYIFKKWWLIVLSMIAFGICALILSNFIPPLYESSAIFSVTIDYTETGALSDIQEDQAMKGVGNLIRSDEVIEDVIAKIIDRSLPYSREQFEKGSALDREEFQWTLRYRSSDPIISRDIVQTWVDISNTIIHESLIHAQIVDSQREYLWNLEECIQYTTGQNSADGFCGYSSTEELVDQIGIVSNSINVDKIAARGMFSPLAVQMIKNPQVPLVPIRHQKNLLIFAGTAVGLLFCILIQGIAYFRSLRIDK
jgi:hypothetical protein